MVGESRIISRVYIFVVEHEARMASFECESVIRGYHKLSTNQFGWPAIFGETYNCVREAGNIFGPFAVAGSGYCNDRLFPLLL